MICDKMLANINHLKQLFILFARMERLYETGCHRQINEDRAL